MKFLEIPMTLQTVVRSAFEDDDIVVIEQPEPGDEPAQMVMLHRSIVPAIIEALQEYLGGPVDP